MRVQPAARSWQTTGCSSSCVARAITARNQRRSFSGDSLNCEVSQPYTVAAASDAKAPDCDHESNAANQYQQWLILNPPALFRARHTSSGSMISGEHAFLIRRRRISGCFALAKAQPPAGIRSKIVPHQTGNRPTQFQSELEGHLAGTRVRPDSFSSNALPKLVSAVRPLDAHR